MWQAAYPQTARLKDDFSNQDDPDFAPNPSYSTVSGNLIVNATNNIGSISDKANQFSNISGNAIYKLTKLSGIFTSPATGDYTLKEASKIFEELPDFENLPISEMGRY